MLVCNQVKCLAYQELEISIDCAAETNLSLSHPTEFNVSLSSAERVNNSVLIHVLFFFGGSDTSLLPPSSIVTTAVGSWMALINSVQCDYM